MKTTKSPNCDVWANCDPRLSCGGLRQAGIIKLWLGNCLSNGFKYFHAWRFLIFSRAAGGDEQSSIFHFQFLFSVRKAGLEKNSESVPSEIWFTSTHRQRYQHHRWFIPVANQRPVSVQHWPMKVRATDLNDLTRYCSWEIVQAPGTGPDFRQWAGERERERPLGGTFILFACHCPDTYFLFQARDLLFAKILVCVPRCQTGEAIILQFS